MVAVPPTLHIFIFLTITATEGLRTEGETCSLALGVMRYAKNYKPPTSMASSWSYVVEVSVDQRLAGMLENTPGAGVENTGSEELYWTLAALLNPDRTKRASAEACYELLSKRDA